MAATSKKLSTAICGVGYRATFHSIPITNFQQSCFLCADDSQLGVLLPNQIIHDLSSLCSSQLNLGLVQEHLFGKWEGCHSKDIHLGMESSFNEDGHPAKEHRL